MIQVSLVGAEIITDGCHRVGVSAQQLQVVGNIAGHAAKFAAHFRNQEGHVQHVHLVRKDVFLELFREHHDGVVGQGTTN